MNLYLLDSAGSDKRRYMLSVHTHTPSLDCWATMVIAPILIKTLAALVLLEERQKKNYDLFNNICCTSIAALVIMGFTKVSVTLL